RMEVVFGAVERDERRLVAPGLDHDRADGDPLALTAVDLFEHTGLRVPLVAAHPEPVDPVGRRFGGPTGHVLESGEDMRGGAGVETQGDERIELARLEVDLDGQARWIGGADVETDAAARVDVEAEAPTDDDRERNRQVGARPLAL